MAERLPPAEYLRARNALWQRLRQLEPHDAGFEPLLEELRLLTNQSRDKVLEGLGLKRVPVTDAVFDLAHVLLGFQNREMDLNRTAMVTVVVNDRRRLFGRALAGGRAHRLGDAFG